MRQQMYLHNNLNIKKTSSVFHKNNCAQIMFSLEYLEKCSKNFIWYNLAITLDFIIFITRQNTFVQSLNDNKTFFQMVLESLGSGEIFPNPLVEWYFLWISRYLKIGLACTKTAGSAQSPISVRILVYFGIINNGFKTTYIKNDVIA